MEAKPSIEPSCLTWALDYIKRGWHIFPTHSIRDGFCTCGKPDCSSPAKHPLAAHGIKDAVIDEAKVRQWWNKWPHANVSIATGRISGLVVVDVDPRHGGRESLAAMEQRFGRIPPTVTSFTGGGGSHILLAYPSDSVITNRQAVGGYKGIDICGDGGAIIAPPSIHTGETTYVWDEFDGPDDTAIAPMPFWLIELCNGTTGYQPAKRKHEPGWVTLAMKGVEEGRRDETCIRLAGHFRNTQPQDITEAILGAFAERCSPPLTEADVIRCVASAYSYERTDVYKGLYTQDTSNGSTQPVANAEPVATAGFLTDTTNAELIVELHSDKLRFDLDKWRWLIWAGHYWKESSDIEVIPLAIEAARERFKRSASIADLKERQRAANWAIQSEQRGRLDSAMALARALDPIMDKMGNWDNNLWLIAGTDGVIDIQGKRFRPGQQDDRITFHSETKFDKDAICPRWLQFLDEVFGRDLELIDWIHRAAGYSLTGDVSEQCFFLCYGSGANGKSVFLATLRHVMGEYAYDAPFATFEQDSRASIPNDLAALECKRFVTSSETNENTRMNEARIKSLSGGDPCTARFLHHEFFTFSPVCKIWLAANHKPRVADVSHGFWRRIHLIPFNQQFSGSEADKGLPDRLKGEASGILNWLIEGCLMWQERGLDPTPAIVRGATQDYKTESDPLAQFLEEKFVISPERKLWMSELYKVYVGWADEQGLREREKLSRNALSRKMSERFQRKHTMRGSVFLGIGMATEG